MKKIYTAKSKIEGKGVFAEEEIKKGEDIIEYNGDKINSDEGDARADEQLNKGHLYIFKLNEEFDIDGDIKDNTAKFINHSCDPNCETVIYDEKEILIVALKDIKKDEELTFDYQLTGDRVIQCNCQSKNCRGMI